MFIRFVIQKDLSVCYVENVLGRPEPTGNESCQRAFAVIHVRSGDSVVSCTGVVAIGVKLSGQVRTYKVKLQRIWKSVTCGRAGQRKFSRSWD